MVARRDDVAAAGGHRLRPSTSRGAASLATHLGHFDTGDEAELRRGRRYAVARRLAGLFASYARQRPRLLIDWLDGNARATSTPTCAWQPELWRALVERVDADPPHIRHQKTVARLREAPSDLPARLSLFGHTRLPCTDIELLRRAGHPPRPAPVAAAPQRRACGGSSPAATARSPVATTPATARSTIRCWPRSAAICANCNAACRQICRPTNTCTSDDRPDTLLGWLQSDIAANAVRPQGRTLAADDRSVQVHSCHGPARQVDVLREVLLGLLQTTRRWSRATSW